ncbi:ABC transporter ATP-binding protein [Thermomonas paludicola]|uniref:ABC transporter ATP-binding protein n=1 Tax=Thermomonas paludicola TaxID=2884874 RepID=UPI002114659B|nr:ABC transporter ATP-binding protein [Thermomonas paludicola]
MTLPRASGSGWWRAWLRPHAPALLLALGLMLAQSTATLVQPWLGGLLTDRLVQAQGFVALLWGLFGLIAAQALLGYATALQLRKVSGRLVADAGASLYAHLQALPLAWHQQRQRGDVLALLIGDIHRLGDYLTGTLVPLLPLALTFAGALLMMLHLAPAIALAVALLVPLLFVLLKLVGRRLRPLGRASMQAWADQSALAGQNLELLPVIKAFATDATEARRYRDGAERLYAADFKQARWQGAILPLVQVAGAAVVLLLLGVAGRDIVGGELRIGQLVSLFLYGLVLINPVSQLANVYGLTQSARGAMLRLSEALAAAPEADDGALDVLPRNGDLEFEGVHFSYPGRAPLFAGFSLGIRAGETVAITGPNGAGKSTLAHLLLRLLEPQQGRITVGGADLRAFRLTALREQIGLVSQQVMLFNASVRENIAYGRACASDLDIERAARAARAHDFIAALPEGYATRVGDQGVKLSGGQKQRIALARALLKDPPILILDEATAMFDPAGELEFIAECHEALKARTVLLITHRPASLALADRVLRLEHGDVQEMHAVKGAKSPASP